MTFTEYERLAINTAAGASTESKEGALLNAALGFAGEGGEICDKVKKYIFHGHDPHKEGEREALIGEVGDVMWYCMLACWALDTTMEQAAKNNVLKLKERYPNGFSAERSEARYT